MPLFAMVPGAAAAFEGSELCHGTTEHDVPEARATGCGAHVSFAVQTPAAMLGLARQAPACKAVHERARAGAASDAASAGWRDATWLPVHNAGACEPRLAAPTVRLAHDAAIMAVLPWRKVVLYDVASGRPLVFYDADGGLREGDAARARAAFAFLEHFNFTLHREEGALGMDGRGLQRMLMLGIRQQKYGNARPDASRRGRVAVANASGDLDAYVAHWDCEAVGARDRVQPTWDALEARMRALLPEACRVLGEAIEEAGVRERLYTAEAHGFMSQGMGIVNNVGASAAYQSPAHCDESDVCWTFAFAVKCGGCSCEVENAG